MSKTRNRLAGLLGDMGDRLLKWFSRWEDRGVMTKTARWLKVSMLGVLVSVIAALSLKAEDQKILCYVVARLPEAIVSDVTVSPSPTAGGDSVKIQATAKVFETSLEDNYISSAYMNFNGDTVTVPMLAVDGKFSDSLEVIEGYLDVSKTDPGTTWVYVNVTTSKDGCGSGSQELIITDDDDDDKDNSEDGDSDDDDTGNGGDSDG